MASSDLVESTENAQRRERAVIAAQACQTCRNRKTKCDEERPKCGLCRRLNVECTYREPLPTKKDKTMVHILDAITRLETKFDNLALGSSTTKDPIASASRASVGTSSNPGNRPYRNGSEVDARVSSESSQGYHHLTIPQEVILWPSIYLHLVNSNSDSTPDLQYVLQEGTPWFLRLSMSSATEKLLPTTGLEAITKHSEGSRVIFPSLTVQRIQEYCDAYFNTFNVLAPILIKDVFIKDVLAPVLEDGYGYDDTESAIVLLVCALGQLAAEGVFGRPVGVVKGTPSGFRGGTTESPPGVEIFNEARRRLGFVATHISLGNVQVMLLLATYYDATSCYLAFWRSTVMASQACQMLIKCQSIDWQSQYGGLVKRAFWKCMLNEDVYHHDLDLPESGIQAFEDMVPLPSFKEGQDASRPCAAASDEPTSYQQHFLALIGLRKVIWRTHENLQESSMTQSETPDDYEGPAMHVICETARQLESWRSLLPRRLQWQDTDKFDFPNVLGPANRRPNETLFSPDQGPIPIGHKYNLDLITAQLRTHFYYARYMLYRPFVYKALHFYELMTPEDNECCALAIKSTLLWPIAMAPPKDKKRLVPHAFSWTQNFLGILLVLRMTTENACLKQICEKHVNREELKVTVGLLLDWIRDMRQVDAVADWGWKILEPLYNAGG